MLPSQQNLGSPSVHQRNAIKWHFAGGPMVACFYIPSEDIENENEIINHVKSCIIMVVKNWTIFYKKNTMFFFILISKLSEYMYVKRNNMT